MDKIAFKNGILMFLTFTAVFLITHLLNLSGNYNFRVLNWIVQIIFIWKAIKEYTNQHLDQEKQILDNYPANVTLGLFTSLFGVLPFALLMGIYLSINNNFMESIKASSNLGDYLTPFTAGLFLVSEGIIFSLIVSYILARVLQDQRYPD
jgi:hypothetical protein